MNVARTLAFLLASLGAAQVAYAHGEPIIVTDADGELNTNVLIYTTELEPLGPLTFTNVPGFEFHGFQPGDVVTFEVVDHLWHWEATAGVVPAPEGLELLIEGLDPPFPTTAVRHNPAHVDGENVFQGGFVLETIDGQSSQHQHLLNYLFETRDVSAGGYGVVLRVSAAGYASTPPFLIAFNQGLNPALFQEAVLELSAAAFKQPDAFPPGDFNRDRVVDALDIDLLYAHRGTGELETFDMNADGAIDDLDARFWVEQIMQTAFGDVNLDRAIDLADLNAVRNHFGAAGGWAVGDSDGSGAVDLVDLNHVRNQFGFSGGAPVPEPSGIALGGVVGALIVVAFRRLPLRDRHRAAAVPPAF